ncbi:MAG: hypothetical protein BGP16_15330 [Sphingobium sp. 66-54]|nr:MAG: hypothetical protein BGP16_15330 [Sphingobium sp. 66-54]
MKITKLCAAAVVATLLMPPPVVAKTTLSEKDRARVARAPAKDRADVRYCLLQRKKGGKTGLLVGAAGGAGASVVAGGDVGETLLAGGAGAVAGHLIGKGTATNSRCDTVLRRNP